MKKVCAYCKHDEFTKDDYGNFVCDACGMCEQELAIFADALALYGHDAQMLKTVEELAELGAEMMHFRDGKVSADVVVSELADVIIMCEQMRLVFGETVVDTKVLEKLERLEKRMEEGYE